MAWANVRTEAAPRGRKRPTGRPFTKASARRRRRRDDKRRIAEQQS